ncbi:hypothetical protein STVIR_3279 [Streptomyces viridochromogenes Tue57]|uniref:MmpS family membrane protein n=1 Tax=Streptomyces viridochromogenes Tue57 TaxID=1160705 RepID=L8PI77_STRVR|nr:hypothetical protein STVIR_3279 [Streptomyces viridochromogenes Tue57]
MQENSTVPGKTQEPEAAETDVEIPNKPSGDRAALLAGGVALAACGGLVLYGVLDSGESDRKPADRTPTAAVTYEVTGKGTADITYRARTSSGEAVVVKAATLPWHKTVDVPLGKEPAVSIVLGEKGGQARCSLAIRGEHAQSATATGTFGRATCAAPLPGQAASDTAEG